MKQKIIPLISWLLTLWIAKVFLTSLFYKFTDHPDTLHIFGTIGQWLGGVLGPTMGQSFARYGAYLVGSYELLTSLVLLLPALLWLLRQLSIGPGFPERAFFHSVGGLMAAAVMSGAVFFHLFTPLGIEVLHQGKSDGGSLFYAAVSILVSGIILFIINRKPENAPATAWNPNSY